MAQPVVRVFSGDSALIEEIETILKEIKLDYEIHDNLGTFVDYHSSPGFIIDQDTVESVDDFNIPPSSYLIVLTKERSFENVRKWMEYKADHVLVIPDELNDLKNIIEEKQSKSNFFRSDVNHSMNHTLGKVSAFYSTNGGSGKSLLASITAQSLQVQHDKRVIIIDLNAQFGGLEVIHALEPSRSYADLKPVIEELALNHIQNVSHIEEETGVQVLLGPAEPEKAEGVTNTLISKVIHTCKQHFDHVILDVPSDLNTISFTGLNEASRIFYIMTPDSLSLRGYKHAIQIFNKFNVGNQVNLSVILNRKHKKAELTEKAISKLIDKPIAGNVHSDFFAIQPLLNMGKPFFTKKGKPLCRAAKNISNFVEKTLI